MRNWKFTLLIILASCANKPAPIVVQADEFAGPVATWAPVIHERVVSVSEFAKLAKIPMGPVEDKEFNKPSARPLFKSVIVHIKTYEGFRSDPYYCAAGYKTVGFGHLIRRGERIEKLSIAEASVLLHKDFIRKYEWALKILPPRDGWERHEHLALAMLAFNCSVGDFQSKSLYREIMRYKAAGKTASAGEKVRRKWLKWCHYKKNGKVIRNEKMYERRSFEVHMFLGGEVNEEEHVQKWLAKKRKYSETNSN